MSSHKNYKNWDFQSLCVHDFLENDALKSHALPIYSTSTFLYESAEKALAVFEGKDSAFIYGRWHNPTVAAVETKLALLETYQLPLEAQCVLFSSGMAAISALFFSLQLQSGDTILTQGNLYGTTTDMLLTVFKTQNINIIFSDFANLDEMEQQLHHNKSIKLIYMESPANPTCACYSLEKIGKLARQYQVKTALDNTFATSYLQRAFAFGIDFVIYSATKFLNGHGSGLSGAVIGTDANNMKAVWNMRKLLGGNSNAFDAFLLNNGLKTLPLRMKVHSANALLVAQYLEDHPKIKKVNYTGLEAHPDYHLAKKQMLLSGGVLSFEIKGSFQDAKKLLNRVQMIKLTASLGTADTLIQHPAGMTHAKVEPAQRLKFGITDTLIRLSVGLEHPDDIIKDLAFALAE